MVHHATNIMARWRPLCNRHFIVSGESGESPGEASGKRGRGSRARERCGRRRSFSCLPPARTQGSGSGLFCRKTGLFAPWSLDFWAVFRALFRILPVKPQVANAQIFRLGVSASETAQNLLFQAARDGGRRLRPAKPALRHPSRRYSVGCASSTMRMRSCWLWTSHLR